MSLNLSKSSSAINLSKSKKGVTKYTVGLAWDEVNGEAVDYDASAVTLDHGKFVSLAFYGEMIKAGVTLSGDNRTGAGEGDDETINIDLSQVAGDEVIVAMTSYNSGNFCAEAHPVARVYEDGKSAPLIEAHLDEEAAFGTALILVRFFKDGDDWKFENISESVGDSTNGLTDVLAKYKN